MTVYAKSMDHELGLVVVTYICHGLRKERDRGMDHKTQMCSPVGWFVGLLLVSLIMVRFLRSDRKNEISCESK